MLSSKVESFSGAADFDTSDSAFMRQGAVWVALMPVHQ
jgi:hypothetical protein